MQVQPSAPGAYSIGQLSRLFNTSRRALRHYESKGLLEPPRDGPYRVYGRREYRRLAVIVEARKIGLSIEQIYDLLSAYDADDRGEAQIIMALQLVKRRLDDLNQMRALAIRSIEELEARLGQGHSARSRFASPASLKSPSNRVDFREPEHHGLEANP